MTEELKKLADGINEYKKYMSEEKKAFAILYTPRACHLVLVDKEGCFFNEHGPFEPEDVFEARIFNDTAELRWLNESEGKGKMAIISDSSFIDTVGTIPQTYLLWGKKVELPAGKENPDGWTKFGTARIGAFYVPIVTNEEYARFKAKEYLKAHDGNVAVVDERLTGIEGYKGE
jgi:CRISPR-associated protein (TIGR03984 family)